MGDGSERRRFERIDSEEEVRVRDVHGTEIGRGRLVNLNGGGVCLRSDRALAVGDRARIETVDSTGEPIPIFSGTIEVVRACGVVDARYCHEIAGVVRELER